MTLLVKTPISLVYATAMEAIITLRDHLVDIVLPVVTGPGPISQQYMATQLNVFQVTMDALDKARVEENVGEEGQRQIDGLTGVPPDYDSGPEFVAHRAEIAALHTIIKSTQPWSYTTDNRGRIIYGTFTTAQLAPFATAITDDYLPTITKL